MHALSSSIASLRDWRRHGGAALAGAISVLAMAPFFLWPVLFLTLPVLVWSIDGTCVARDQTLSVPANASQPSSALRRTLRHPTFRAGLIGWWFGFGYFVPGLFWIGEAFLVEAEKFAVLLPFAVTLLPAGLALFWGAATALASRAWSPGLPRLLALALALSAAEWLRGHVLSGFPWNVLGYALTWSPSFMQSAAVLGIYGLTLVAVVVFATPLVLTSDVSAGRLAARWRTAGFAIAAIPLFMLAVFGAWRLDTADDAPDSGVRVRIVQPSIPQREKWRPENQQRIFAEHIALSLHNAAGEKDDADGVRLIVWPEAAMPFLPLQSPGVLASIGRMLPEGSYLLSGGLRLEEPIAGAPPGAAAAQRRVFNSLIAFDSAGRAAAIYDKIHLVPFGEYLPLQTLLESIGLEQLSRMRGGFATGPTPRPLIALPGLPELGPLICYEAIFPGAVVQGADRPAALVNITNDGWFGNTTGPRQHLHQTRVRAIEEGLPILRAANNGISAVFDGKGRVLGRLGLDVKGSIDATLPAPLAPPFYARHGDLIFWIAWLIGLAALFLVRHFGSPASRTQ